MAARAAGGRAAASATGRAGRTGPWPAPREARRRRREASAAGGAGRAGPRRCRGRPGARETERLGKEDSGGVRREKAEGAAQVAH